MNEKDEESIELLPENALRKNANFAMTSNSTETVVVVTKIAAAPVNTAVNETAVTLGATVIETTTATSETAAIENSSTVVTATADATVITTPATSSCTKISKTAATPNNNDNTITSAATIATAAVKVNKILIPGPMMNDRLRRILNDSGKDNSRHFNSLPLFHNMENSELCEIGSRPGMECMPLRAPPGPYHHYHHVTDQTKSLQELQNEVGALLEFRDLVIETFPDLKHKMASMSATNTLTGGTVSSSLASRREWEPGIRIKRKITPKDATEMTSSSLIRSRSNSHSGKKELKSGGEGNGSVVQDSGFSTETSSSKEAHSASSTTGAMQGAVASNRLPIDADDELLNLLDVIHRKSNRLRDEVEHLQNIERTKLRKNTVNIPNSNLSNSNDNNGNSSSNNAIRRTFQEHVDRLTNEDIKILRKERDRLLDKLAEMEAETLAGRIKASKMHDQFEELCSVKKELEEQLKLALSQKLELNTRLHELHKQYSNKSSSSSQSDSTTTTTSHRHSSTVTVLPMKDGAVGVAVQPQQQQSTNVTTTTSSFATPIGNRGIAATTFTPVIIDQMNFVEDDFNNKQKLYPFHSNNNNINNSTNSSNLNNFGDIKQLKSDFKNLGHLDGLISSPNRLCKVRMTDSRKIAAILLETNVLELQRHLLTLTVQNQVLTQRLEQATKSKIFLAKKLDKSKEDIDDLRFQLEEKDIELEGTKAQLRILESKTSSKFDFGHETNRSSSTIILTSTDSPLIRTGTPTNMEITSPTVTQISTPSMKAMIPLAMDEIQHHSSSTESAQDQTEREIRLSNSSGILDVVSPTSTKYRHGSTSSSNSGNSSGNRPSKIPLPGTKGYLAPKPPTGRTNINSSASSTVSTTTGNMGSASKSGSSVSNKNLSRSTGNLFGSKSGPLSSTSSSSPSTRRNIGSGNENSNVVNNQVSSLNRPDSVQSLRKDNSLGTNSRSSSSSIPISAKSVTPSPQKINNSPIPKPKRDSLTSRVRHLDSLSRVHNNNNTNNNNNSSNNHNTNSNSNNSTPSTTSPTRSSNYHNITSSSSPSAAAHLSKMRRDLSSSFTQGQTRDRNGKQSSSSPSSTTVSHQQQQHQQSSQNDTDSGKEEHDSPVQRKNSYYEYFAKDDESNNSDGRKERQRKKWNLVEYTNMKENFEWIY